MKLTSRTVESLQLPPGKNEMLVFDERLPGFGIRIRAGGKRTWIVQYRVGQKQRRVTLGTTNTLDADKARERAKIALSKVHLGADPQTEKAEARAQAAVTFENIVDDYLTRYATKRLKPDTLSDVKRYLRTHWSALARLPIRKVTRADVATRLACIAEENGGFAANRARAALSSFFSWAIAEGVADANPVVGTRRPVEEISRDRVLNDDELRLVWRCAGPGDYGAVVRLLILTAQRREEVGGMLWSELALANELWKIGPERTKNGLAHDVPLSSPAIEILKGLSRRDGRALVFGSRNGPFSGWSKAKASLDARILAEMREANKDAKLQPWRLHDIRRTVATGLADLGVLPHVVEATLNHISGHKAGVAGVYNRSSYSNEKRDALKLWASHVLALVEGRLSKIVSITKNAGGAA